MLEGIFKRKITGEENCVPNDDTFEVPGWGTVYKISTPETLLKPHLRNIDEIKQLVSVDEATWDSLYIQPLANYSSSVQLLPASQYHHHDHLGGLLAHTIQTTRNALKLRFGKILPPNEAPESIGARADKWTWGVYIAALCHDIGKPLLDMVCMLFNEKLDPIGRWNPFSGPMTQIKGASFYCFQYLPNRKYEHHSIGSPFLLNTIVAPRYLDWLGRDQEALISVMKSIGGDATNIVGELVKKADAESARVDLGGQSLPRAVKNVMSFGDKIRKSLGRLFDSGEVTLNRKGAAGFVSNDSLWVVSKRFLELLRKTLLADGHMNIPSDNNRLMDVLLEYKLIQPVSDDGKVIWNVVVSIDDWKQRFTVLRINPSTVPGLGELSQFSGELVVESNLDATSTHDDNEPEKSEGEGREAASGVVAKPIETNVNHQRESSSTPSNLITEKHKDNDVEITQHQERGKMLLDWIRQGLLGGSIKYNATGAQVHVVLESDGCKSVLLVSPALFKKAMVEISGFADLSLSQVQKAFQNLGMHTPGKDGDNFTTYKIQGKRSSSTIKGYRVADWGIFFDMEPNCNSVMKPN